MAAAELLGHEKGSMSYGVYSAWLKLPGLSGAVAATVIPPIAVLIFGYVIAWILRGFRTG
jgi:hypothetical protein